MIISHSKKFIFFKPAKVAGTSLELALARSCSKDDVIASIGNLHTGLDGEMHEQPGQNSRGYYEHMTPLEVKKIISPDIWNNYTKVTIARNPWDMVVSRWFWQKHTHKHPNMIKQREHMAKRLYDISRGEGGITYSRVARSLQERFHTTQIKRAILCDDFETFSQCFLSSWTNDDFYFMKKSTQIYDKVLRFNYLENDYANFCSEQGIKFEPLPNAKSKVRPPGLSYSSLYNSSSFNAIKNQFRNQIDVFNYQF